MKSLSNVGLGMSVIFGLLLMALLAELYYLLWWKKRIITDARIEQGNAKELFFMFCWKSPKSSLSSNHVNDREIGSSSNLVRGLQQPRTEVEEQNVERELMMMGLSGPAKFLCTIKEETMEDLESDDGRKRRGSRIRSLSSDVVVETPFLTPVASPPYFTPPLTPPTKHSSESTRQSSSSPSSSSSSSPLLSFKFLRDAEEKANREKMKNDDVSVRVESCDEETLSEEEEEENGSFITLVFTSSEDELSRQTNNINNHNPNVSDT